MENLNEEVESLIATLNGVIGKELKFIKDEKNNWTEVQLFKKKLSTHDLHYLLTERNVKHAKKLYELADKVGDIDKKEVRGMLKKLTSFFELYEARVSGYIEIQDFTELIDKIEDKDFNVKAELEFQSNLTKNITVLREIIIRLTRMDDKSAVSIKLFNDTPIPLTMRIKAESHYPEIVDALEAKISISNAKETKEKSTEG